MKNQKLQKNDLMDWQYKELGEVLNYEQPINYIVSSDDYRDHYPTPVLTAGKTFILGYTDECFGIYNDLPAIIFDDFTTAHQFVDFSFKVKSSAIKILKAKKEVNIKFIYGWMQLHPYIVGEHKRNYISDYQYQNILLPPLSEQNRIVSVLETWDKVIEKLTKKIEIKKNIKKGLMQQLLTGEIRLNGFSDKWKSFRLGDISKMSSGGTPSSKVEQYYNGNIPWVSITDMTKQGKYIVDTDKKLTKEGLQNSAAKVYPSGTILYAMYASIGECGIAVREMTSSQAILGIEPDKNKLNNIYLYYFLTHLKDEIKLLGQQGTQSNLNAGIVKDFKIDLPVIKEQEFIVDVLQSSDKEINALEAKLSLLKSQKKYLLNNLISGKIRTPENLKINS